MEVKELIFERLRATRRKNIEAVISHMEQYAFFERSSSRHHRNIGGLAEHAWQSYLFAQKVEAEQLDSNPKRTPLDADSIAICALLHDFCRCGGLRYVFPHKHGIRSAEMLKVLGLELSREEYIAIRYHMGLKNKENEPLYPEALKSQLRYVISRADGKSAAMNEGYEVE